MFDPSQPASDGSFWCWRSLDLDRKLLDQLYYDVAVANRPEAPNRLDDSNIYGGFTTLASEQVFVYRFGDGGRDAHGRPGRFVMLVAAFTRDQVKGIDLAGILTSRNFKEILAKAKMHCPVPPPADLEVDFSVSFLILGPQFEAYSLHEDRTELTGPDVLSKAAKLCSSFPGEREWSCGIQVDGDVNRAVILLQNRVQARATEATNSLNSKAVGRISDPSVQPHTVLTPYKNVFRQLKWHALILGLFVYVGLQWSLGMYSTDKKSSGNVNGHSMQTQTIQSERPPNHTAEDINWPKRPQTPVESLPSRNKKNVLNRQRDLVPSNPKSKTGVSHSLSNWLFAIAAILVPFALVAWLVRRTSFRRGTANDLTYRD